MTAKSNILDGMDFGKESVALSGIVEAVAWRHALKNTSDPGFLRRGQRVIVCPKFLTKFKTVMTTGNIGLDMDGCHDIAYERIMSECQRWSETCRPLFLPDDSAAVRTWPALAEKVSNSMEEAKRIAVGGYKQVLENGPEVHVHTGDDWTARETEERMAAATLRDSSFSLDRNCTPTRTGFSGAHHTGLSKAAGPSRAYHTNSSGSLIVIWSSLITTWHFSKGGTFTSRIRPIYSARKASEPS
jgi:hypothetical protein